MHIAQFVHRYPPALGGAEAYTSRLSEYLAGRGDDVRVWTTTAVKLEEMWYRSNTERHRRSEEKDPTVKVPSSPHIFRYAPLHFPARRFILKAISLVPLPRWQCLTTPCNPICPRMWRDAGRYDGPLDAVHATAFPYSFPIACALRLAHRRNVPFYLTPFLHLGDPTSPHDRVRKQYTAPHLRWLLREADGVFVQTRAERDMALALGISESHVHFQGLGVDSVECTGGDRTTTRSRWKAQPDEVVVGHLANNSFEKGTVDLLHAAEQAWARNHRFRLVLAGPEMPSFRERWRAFSAKDRVTRLGILSDDHKRDFFAGIDVFALPSRSDSFGLVLLEAWANGKPNLVYRAGGPAELVRDGIDGLHARSGDVVELTEQLIGLIEDEGQRRRLGASGLDRVEREFQWGDKLEMVREVFASGTGQRTARGSRLSHFQDDEVHITVRSENV